MANLTPIQIAQLAYNAGFRGNALNTAVAVAIAESGGNPYAYNPEKQVNTPDGHGSRGLWQIYGFVHPKYDGEHAFDPKVNAQGAYEIYKQSGGKFTAWSTYNLGWAQPKQDYAKMIKGGSTVSVPKTTGAQGNTNNSASSLSGGGSASVESDNPIKNISTDLIDSLFGQWRGEQRTSTDFISYVSGVGLIVISLIAFVFMTYQTAKKGF
jgi:hypothetical protein